MAHLRILLRHRVNLLPSDCKSVTCQLTYIYTRGETVPERNEGKCTHGAHTLRL